MNDNELAELFERNGLRRVQARALTCFRDGKERSAAEVERETGLRQPEVCTSMAQMVLMGWFKAEHIPKPEGLKGRPYVVYHLAKSYGQICQDIARERSVKLAGMMEDIRELQAVA